MVWCGEHGMVRCSVLNQTGFISHTENQQKSGEHQQPLTEDKGMSLSIWIAAAVGGLVVLLIILVAFGIYRIRR